MRRMFRAIKRMVDEQEDLRVVYPIHMNPAVRSAAAEVFGNDDRFHIIEPLDVLDFHNFLARSFLILTDSGGIQEEAPGTGQAGSGTEGYHRAAGGCRRRYTEAGGDR